MQLLTAIMVFSCICTHSNLFAYFKVIVQYNEKFTVPLELIASHKDKILFVCVHYCMYIYLFFMYYIIDLYLHVSESVMGECQHLYCMGIEKGQYSSTSDLQTCLCTCG